MNYTLVSPDVSACHVPLWYSVQVLAKLEVGEPAQDAAKMLVRHPLYTHKITRAREVHTSQKMDVEPKQPKQRACSKCSKSSPWNSDCKLKRPRLDHLIMVPHLAAPTAPGR